ncbi:SpoIID/LytB domain-containing protein [Candidatus Clostridium stratigraminis]|uniref:SpoIID/LytB domain-containing protein n=1 Tax=Candidatus Clostridium stratigraminis TaxID=3381661 RepID=A0ABW8T539_9CLOT
MFSKRFNKLIALSTIAAVLISSPIIGQAASISDTYMKGISVGLTSVGSIKTLDFTLTGDYIIDGQGVIISGNSGSNRYNICLSTNSTLNLYKNGVLFYSANSDITIKPLNTNTFIQFKKKTEDLNPFQYAGSMTFKNNGTSFSLINNLKIEDYLKGVVPYEEPNSWPVESLKAQSVAARTYAIGNAGKYSKSGYDLTDDTNCQVYNGYSDGFKNSNTAVDATSGKVLIYNGPTIGSAINGSAIDALFSASNGGYMERSENVWTASLPYFKDMSDRFDTNNQWSVTYTKTDLERLLKQKLNGGTFDSIDIPSITTFNSGRISGMNINYIDNTTNQISPTPLKLGKEAARTFFSLNSALYKVKLNADGSYTFTGSGNGHGVGLSQWGSYYMAKAGLPYNDYNYILNYYYNQNNNVQLQNAYSGGKIINTTNRIGGLNRYETSVQIANNMYSNKIDNVVLATGSTFPDALSGSVLAKAVSAPILLVGTKSTSTESLQALNYIKSHLNPGGKVYLLGGEGVISKEFYDTLTKMGYNSIRLGGSTRFDTNNQIVNQLKALNAVNSTGLVIATANNFPDALSISPVAALNGWPVLLSNKDSLTADEESYIKSMKPDKVYIAGGNGVVTDAVLNRIKTLLGYGDDKVIRLWGSDRYATSRVINSTLFDTPNKIGIATGLQFADALSGSVYAALNGAPIVLVDPSKVTEAQNYIKYAGSNANSINATIFGQTGAVNVNVLSSLTSVTN